MKNTFLASFDLLELYRVLLCESRPVSGAAISRPQLSQLLDGEFSNHSTYLFRSYLTIVYPTLDNPLVNFVRTESTIRRFVSFHHFETSDTIRKNLGALPI